MLRVLLTKRTQEKRSHGGHGGHGGRVIWAFSVFSAVRHASGLCYTRARPASRFSRSETAEQSTVTVNSSVHTVTSVRAFLFLGHEGKGQIKYRS